MTANNPTYGASWAPPQWSHGDVCLKADRPSCFCLQLAPSRYLSHDLQIPSPSCFCCSSRCACIDVSVALLHSMRPSIQPWLQSCPAMSNYSANYWGRLINPDKSPAPLLEQLCLEIARLMVSERCATVEDQLLTLVSSPDLL